MQSTHVEFELPTALVSQAGLNVKNLNNDVKQVLAFFLYEHNRISLGKACELGGMTKWEFSDLNKKLGIKAGYTNDDLKEDLLRLTDV